MKITNSMIRRKLRIYPIMRGEIGTLSEMIETYKLMNREYIVMPGTGDRVQGGEAQGLEEYTIKRIEYIERLEKELSDMWIVYRAINAYISSLIPDSLEEHIINMRYIQRRPLSWYSIARKLKYSVDWVQHKDCEIIEDIAKLCVFRQKK